MSHIFIYLFVLLWLNFLNCILIFYVPCCVILFAYSVTTRRRFVTMTSPLLTSRYILPKSVTAERWTKEGSMTPPPQTSRKRSGSESRGRCESRGSRGKSRGRSRSRSRDISESRRSRGRRRDRSVSWRSRSRSRDRSESSRSRGRSRGQ